MEIKLNAQKGILPEATAEKCTVATAPNAQAEPACEVAVQKKEKNRKRMADSRDCRSGDPACSDSWRHMVLQKEIRKGFLGSSDAG